MRKTQKIFGMLLTLLLAIGASAITVSAKAIGEDYTIMDFNAGWVLVAIALIVAFIFASKIVKMPKNIGMRPVIGIVALMLVIGLALVFVETPIPTTAEVTGLSDLEFDIEASAVTTDGTYYPDTRYSEATGIFTVPYGANTTSDTLLEDGDNSSYTDDPRLNFTIKADFPDNEDDNDLAIIYFEVTNPTLYVDDSDNYVLVEDDDERQAIWTDQDGITSTIEGWTSGGIEEILTVTLDLELYEAGLSQADAYDDHILNIRFHNKANTRSETFQVVFECTGTWAST